MLVASSRAVDVAKDLNDNARLQPPTCQGLIHLTSGVALHRAELGTTVQMHDLHGRATRECRALKYHAVAETQRARLHPPPRVSIVRAADDQAVQGDGRTVLSRGAGDDSWPCWGVDDCSPLARNVPLSGDDAKVAFAVLWASSSVAALRLKSRMASTSITVPIPCTSGVWRGEARAVSARSWRRRHHENKAKRVVARASVLERVTPEVGEWDVHAGGMDVPSVLM